MGERLEQYVESSRQTFLNMPELPEVEVSEDGQEVSSFSTTFEAMRTVLDTYSPDHKLAIIGELMSEEVIVEWDSGLIDSGERSMSEVLDDVLIYGLAD